MRQAFAGAVLVVAGIAAFTAADRHEPLTTRFGPPGIGRVVLHRGLSPTAYDLLRIGAWALVIVGELVVVTGLVRYWGAQTRR
jgi:hypothetical protein